MRSPAAIAVPEDSAAPDTVDAVFGWLKQRSAVAKDERDDEPVEATIASADAARERGDVALAIAGYERAHARAPDRVYPLYWLATLLEQSGSLEKAAHYARAGLELDPGQVALLLRLGGIAHKLRDPAGALVAYERVAALAPDVEGIDALLADQLCYVGRVGDGLAAFDRAIANDPGSPALRHNRLFCLNYSAQLSPQALADEHRAWGRALEARIAPLPAAVRPESRKLHVGYLSPDLRDHAVAAFLAPLLAHHDGERFRVSCFDTSTDPEDAVTASLRASVSHWHRVASLDDDALAAKLRELCVDILVDLSGHTRLNRLEVFARRPADVQVTWLGYLCTTGLTRMDYRLTDAQMDPPGLTDHLHTERLVRLPVQGCFKPSAGAPPPRPKPAGAPMSFGSLNQWPKVSPGVRDTWAQILRANPHARLRVVARGGHTAAMRELVTAEFVRRGAKPGQIEVFPFLSTPDFLEFLNGIDVALDPWPYGGGTTTFQCLWMGVPVVTLEGKSAMSRNSIGPLVNVGLADLVARTAEEYVDIATRLLADRSRLSDLRESLRDRMSNSPLMDGAAFARSVEQAYETMWRERLMRGQTQA